MQGLFREKLTEWHIDWQPSRQWVHKLLHGMGLSYKKTAKSKLHELSDDVKEVLGGRRRSWKVLGSPTKSYFPFRILVKS